MNKKGISAIVANVLIVLLVVAGVVLLWTAVRPTIEQAGEQVGADCVTLDLEVVSCDVTANSVSVRRNAGSGDLGGAKLIIGDGTLDCNEAEGLGELESVDCSDYVAEVMGTCTDGSVCSGTCSDGSTCTGYTAESGTDLVGGEEVQVAAIAGNDNLCNPLRSAFIC